MATEFSTIALQTMWLLSHSREFLMEHADQASPDFFPNAAERQFVQWCLRHYRQNNEVITERAIEQAMSDEAEELEQAGISEKSIWRLYDNLIPVKKRETKYAWTQAERFFKHQSLRAAVITARDALDEGDESTAEEALRAALNQVTPQIVKKTKLFGDIAVVRDRVTARNDNNDWIRTGLPKLDQKMDGGLRRGEVAVFLAPTGRGKTMWLCNTAAAALYSGVEPIYYTLEVDQDTIWSRTMASAAGVSINDIDAWLSGSRSDPELAHLYKGKKSPELRIEALQKRLVRMGHKDLDMEIRDIAMRKANLDVIFNDLDKVRSSGGDPGLIIIDYADRLTSRGRYERGWEGQEEIYKELQAAAKEFDIAIWTASQAGRGALNRAVIDMNLIQGAFSKTFECTYVIGAGQTERMRGRNLFNFFVAKARRSSADSPSFLVKYDLARANFKSEAAEDEDSDNFARARSFEKEPDDEEALNDDGKKKKSDDF